MTNTDDKLLAEARAFGRAMTRVFKGVTSSVERTAAYKARRKR